MNARPTTALLGVPVLCLATVARADPPRLRVDYRGDTDCPSAEAFLDSLRERLPDVVLVGPGEPATVARVTAGPAPEGAAGFTGQVTFYSAEGADAERQVEAASCDDVIGALALIVSVYVRSSADSAPSASARRDPSPESSQRPRDLPARAPLGPESDRWLVWTGLGGGFRSGVAEGLAPEVFASGGLFLDRASIMAPSVRLRIGYAWGVAVPERTAEEVSLRLFTIGLEACPLNLRVSPRWLHVLPCVRVEAGVHTASLDTKPSGVGSWLAAGPLLEARGNLSEHFWVAAGGAALFPAVRNEFVAQSVPEQIVVDTPAVSFEASASAGLSF